MSFVKGGSVGVVGGMGPEPENVQCPRCESTNTKFCYYNNYNLSHPRYFCKACRRYWTRGGTLRNIPIGGGPRKNSKRIRPTPQTPSPIPVSFIAPVESNFNESLPLPLPSPLPPVQVQSPFLGLGGYGLGSGFDGLGFGDVQDQDQEPEPQCETWRVGETNGEDCFGWGRRRGEESWAEEEATAASEEEGVGVEEPVPEAGDGGEGGEREAREDVEEVVVVVVRWEATVTGVRRRCSRI